MQKAAEAAAFKCRMMARSDHRTPNEGCWTARTRSDSER
jgi:hypothetical protein